MFEAQKVSVNEIRAWRKQIENGDLPMWVRCSNYWSSYAN